MKSIQKDIAKPNKIPVNYVMDEDNRIIYYFERLNLFFIPEDEIFVRIIQIGRNNHVWLKMLIPDNYKGRLKKYLQNLK